MDATYATKVTVVQPGSGRRIVEVITPGASKATSVSSASC